MVKSRHKLQGIDSDYDYGEWYELTKPTEEELARQREEWMDFRPKLSIVIPAYQTPERYLKELLDSIFARPTRTGRSAWRTAARRGRAAKRVLRRYANRDDRVKYLILGENKGIVRQHQRGHGHGLRGTSSFWRTTTTP